MEKTLEIEELMELLKNINASLEENEVSLSNMKENILDIKNEESKLKKIYPNLCLLEQIRTNIEMNKDNIQGCDEEDKEAIATFEEEIVKLEEQASSILKKLEGSDVMDKKDYEV